MQKRRTLESSVQSNLIKELNDRGWAVLRLHPSELHIPDDKKVRKNGLPDLVAFKTKGIIFIEVKRTGETFEPLQYVFSKILRKFGVKSTIYRGGDDVDQMLES